MTRLKISPVLLAQVAKGCPTCQGRGMASWRERDSGDPTEEDQPCPECARVAALVAEQQEETDLAEARYGMLVEAVRAFLAAISQDPSETARKDLVAMLADSGAATARARDERLMAEARSAAQHDEAVRAQEREACAILMDEYAEEHATKGDGTTRYSDAYACAAIAIRARKS